MDDGGLKWVLCDGLGPVVGFSLFFLVVLKIGHMAKDSDKLELEQAADSLAWLYAGVVLSLQLMPLAWTKHSLFFSLLVFTVIVCALMLSTGMRMRAKTASWKPEGEWYFWSVLMMIGVLAAGYNLHGVPDVVHQ